jgi:hypothetical protein
MKLVSTRGRCASSALFVAALTTVLAANDVQAATSYFDTNGTGAGSGVSNGGSYSWEGTVWNADSTGVAVPAPWTDADFPKFAAGTDAAVASYAVTASAVHTINGMQLATAAASPGTILNIATSGAGALNIGTGPQGFFVATNGNLKINSALGGVDGTSQLVWQGGGGSLYLYGANTFAGGVQLNAPNGLNFNNSASFGPAAAPITFGSQAATSASTSLTYVIANPDVGPVTIR